MHTWHLHLGPSQVLIYSLNLGNDISDFIFDGRLFHIFGPKDLKIWLPNLLVFISVTIVSFYLTFKFSLGVNKFFKQGGLISLRVLNILKANVFNLCISMVGLLLLRSKVSKSLS